MPDIWLLLSKIKTTWPSEPGQIEMRFTSADIFENEINVQGWVGAEHIAGEGWVGAEHTAGEG